MGAFADRLVGHVVARHDRNDQIALVGDGDAFGDFLRRTGMNVVAALLGFFVLRPIIKTRLAPASRVDTAPVPIEQRIRRVA